MADLAAMLQKVRDLVSAGAYAQALALLSKLQAKHRDNPNVLASLCRLLTIQSRYEEALVPARRAVKLAPGDTNMLTNLANLLLATDATDEAASVYQRVIEIDPSRRAARAAYCSLLLKQHRCWAAAEAARVGLDRVPGDMEFLTVLGLSVRECGRADRAIEILRDCVERYPRELQPALLLANSLNYIDEPPEEVARAHRALDGLTRGTPAPPPARPLDGRPLRVGVFSADLRGHSVAYFIEPVLREFDREGFEFICFSDAVREDEFSERLKGLATRWHQTCRLRTEEHEQLARSEHLDVVLDLAGLSRGNRLEVLKGKPAPVQVTYCGYPNSTGLKAVDYRLVDSVTDPAGYDERCTERLIRLDPCFLCFSPLKGAPETAPPPCAGAPHAPVTFGSFNALFKLSDRTVRLWSAVLDAVPGSRLALKNQSMSELPVREDILARFAARGVDPGRIEFVGWVPKGSDPLRAYDLVDVALDTAPYNGTTTTCEAMVMGVPVVALEGETHAGRVGVSLLRAIGRGEWVAGSDDDYVRIAAGLAADREGLARTRTGLRDQLLGSTLCDAAGFTRRFEAALLRAWREKTGL